MFLLTICLLFALSLESSAVTNSSRPYPDQARVTSLYDSLTHPLIDEQKSAIIKDLSLVRGGQRIVFTSGTIHFFAPVNHTMFGAVFSGSGTFTVTPPTEMERNEFERQTGNRLEQNSHTYTFQRAVLWFADSIFEELQSHLQFQNIQAQRTEQKAIDRSLQYATYYVNENSVYRIMQEMVEKTPEPFLLAHFFLDVDGNDLFLECDRRRFEEVVIEQPWSGASTGYDFSRIALCSFHLPEEYTSSTEYELTQEDKRRLKTVQNTIAIECKRDPQIKGSATMDVSAIDTPLASAKFYLYPKLKVRSINTTSGRPLSFLRKDNDWSILIFLPQQESSTYHLQFTYEGDFLRTGRTLLLASSTGWYPQSPDEGRSMFDMTFRIPDDLQLVAAGTKRSDTIIAGRRELRYVTREPSLIVSFSLGDFKEDVVKLGDSDVSVHVYDVREGSLHSVGIDVAQSIRLFTHLFGEFPYKELKVTLGSAGQGQAFPELIHLSWIKESIGEQDQAVYIDRAHEVAHAYWGHAVGWQSYHDQWLSEGIAEYSSLLYGLFVLRRDQYLFETLKRWREQITEGRKFVFGSGPAVGSIWLGYRSSSRETPDDYTRLAYFKGGWVIHMLRMMLINLQTSNEDAFRAMMSDFYKSFKGRDASTSDFMHITEKYFHTSMKWFFDEWIYKSAIPTYKVTQSISRNQNSKWSVKLSVTQTDVPDTFKMLVPIEIRLKNNSSLFGRLMINKAVNEFSYEVEQEPDKILFNPFESVLCKIEE